MATTIQNANDTELIEIAKQCVVAYNANPADYPASLSR